jgi:hypothetical protein
MLQKLPTSLKVILFSLCATSSFAADISFSGETQVCPGQDYSYTASASNIFGSRAGQWEWTFWRNNQIIGSFGYVSDCPPSPGSSSSSVTFNWGNTLGPVKIRVRFKGVNDPLCQFTSADEKWVDVTVRVISPGPISGLLFCASNETRTVSIPGILPFNSAQSCYYHYRFDWIVPSGWSVVPATNDLYDNIPGGIRTFATSVRVTSQSTPLAPRNDGNYNVIVRTEPVWPWPMESTGKIWVGNPPADNSTLIWSGIRGVNPISVNAGSISNYQVDNVLYTTSYSWSLPRGFTAYGSSTTTTGPQIDIIATSQAGTYSLLCRANNACGSSWTNSLTINVVGSGGGGGIQMRAAYPNPANDSFTVKVKEEDSKELAEVSLINKNMERVYFIRTEEKEINVSTANLLPGVYYLNMVLGKEVTQKQVVINH